MTSRNPSPAIRFERHARRELVARSVKGALVYPVVVAVLVGLSSSFSDGQSFVDRAPRESAGFVVAFLVVAVLRLVVTRRDLARHDRGDPPLAFGAVTAAILGPGLTLGLFVGFTWVRFGLGDAALATTILALGFAAAGTSSLAMVRRVHALFLLLVLLPTTIGVAIGGYAGMNLLFVMYGVFLLREAQQAHASFRSSVTAAFELEDAGMVIAARNRGMRRVLDNVSDGLAIIDLEGRLAVERSATFAGWYGGYEPRCALADVVAPGDADFGLRLALDLEMLREDALPLELVLDQMPSRIDVDGGTRALAFRPIHDDDGTLQGLLLVITDITEQLARERSQASEREMLGIVEGMARDRAGYLSFAQTLDLQVAAVANDQGERHEQLRALHTIKGNAAMHGAVSVEQLCHELEEQIRASGESLPPASKRVLADTWEAFSKRLQAVVGQPASDQPLVDLVDRDELVAQLRRRRPHDELLALVDGWALEPVRRPFARLRDEALRLAEELDAGPLEVICDGGGLRLPEARWGGFWAALVHVVRNAVDHGFEPAEIRAQRGKPATRQLRLTARDVNGGTVVVVEDDGGGIDWSRVRAKAAEAGLASETHEDLVQALFSPGLSSRDEVTQTSGRGVGLDAARGATRRLGGEILVQSSVAGTRMEFRFAAADDAAPQAAVA